jgi:hypothetical protein
VTANDVLSLLPDPLDVPTEQRGEASLPMRYEDVSQDGRLACRAMTHALGPTLWEKVLVSHPMSRPMMSAGIVPILSRLSAVSLARPIAFGPRPKTRGAFDLVRATDARGRTRFRLDMDVSLHGVVGRTHPPPPPDAGAPIDVGRVWAEHVLTRPFGPPEARRVDALPEGVRADREATWREPESTLELPPGARWIDAEAIADPHVLVLGLGHTDSNQHVNSLVYPLAIEEAALRHPARPTAAGFCHHFELAFRKPFFAQEKLQVTLRGYARGEAFGVIARCVAGDGEARTFGRLELVP